MTDQRQDFAVANLETDPGPSSRRVMIIDDDYDFAETLKDILEPKGYETAVYHTSSQALEQGESFHPHIALIDIRLGRESGIDLIKTFKERGWKTLCVMVTAYGTLDTAVGALQEGAYDYLRKPVDAMELFSTLDRCFEKIRLEREKIHAEETLKDRNRELEQINSRLRLIVESAHLLPSCSELRQLGPLLLREFLKNMGAEGGSLYVCRDDALELVTARNENPIPETIPFPLKSRSPFSVAIETKEPVLVRDITEIPEIESSGGDNYRNSSFLILPLLDDKGVTLGLIALHNKAIPPFTPQDRELGAILASLSAEVLRELKATQALQESEERFRTLVSNIPGTVYRCHLDPDWTMEFISENIEEISGYPSSDFIQNRVRTYDSIIHPEDRSAVSEEVQERVRKKEAFLLEYRIQHADGSIRWVYEKGQPIFTRDGNVLWLDGAIFDISDQKKLIQDKERLFALSIDMLAIGTFDGHLKQVNPAWSRLGWTEEELTSKPWIDFVHPEDRERTLDAINDLKSGYPLFVFENRFQCKNGDYRWISWNSVPIKGEDLIFSVARDITDLKREEEARREMELQAQRAQKMESLGVLAGGIAHDFNNILSGILGYTNLALLDLEEDSMAYSNLLEVMNAANRASDLVQQILAFSRQNKKNRRAVQLDLILKEVLKLLRASIPSTIEIRQSIQKDVGYVLIDPTEAHQVVMNLCTNACHAMEESGGTLEVSLEKNTLHEQIPLFDNQILPAGEYAQLKVRDTGAGIPSEVQSRIFEPFFTTKDVGKGTGMGLSVVHGVITRIGGAITCESQPNEGTAFTVYMPLTAKEKRDVAPHDDVFITGRGRILLVDDETMIVKMGVRILERNGYEVVGVSDSQEALEKFKEDPEGFDLVVTDYTMPKMTGDRLARKIFEVRPETPIIMTTGLVQESAAKQAREIGIREVVMKPFRPSHFTRTVQNVIEMSRKED
ncbi:MAG: response regulator [Candidatus Omnitrophica bacterium]|nr:response regulator [Candidatus Omnitrophota bacterium]